MIGTVQNSWAVYAPGKRKPFYGPHCTPLSRKLDTMHVYPPVEEQREQSFKEKNIFAERVLD
jgi:hypothetical protein